MELDSLLKYQAIDGELRKIKREMLSNKNCAIAENAKRQFGEMKQVVEKSESVATKVYGGYGESLKHYEETAKKAESLMAKLDSDKLSAEEAEEVVAQLEALKEKLAEIEAYVNSIKKKGEEAVREYKLAQKNGKELKEKYAEAKEQLAKLEEQYKPKIVELQAKLAEAKKAVPAEYLAQYEKLVAENKYPAFVEAYVGDDKTIACTACGYAMPTSAQSDLRQKGFCTCEKCRRVIYYKNK